MMFYIYYEGGGHWDKDGNPMSRYGRFELVHHVEEDRGEEFEYDDWRFILTDERIIGLVKELDKLWDRCFDKPKEEVWYLKYFDWDMYHHSVDMTCDDMLLAASKDAGFNTIKKYYDDTKSWLLSDKYVAECHYKDYVKKTNAWKGKPFDDKESAIKYVKEMDKKQKEWNNPLIYGEVSIINFLNKTDEIVFKL